MLKLDVYCYKNYYLSVEIKVNDKSVTKCIKGMLKTNDVYF